MEHPQQSQSRSITMYELNHRLTIKFYRRFVVSKSTRQKKWREKTLHQDGANPGTGCSLHGIEVQLTTTLLDLKMHKFLRQWFLN